MYARINSVYRNLAVKCKNLVSKLENQGYLQKDLRRVALRFCRERHDVLQHFDMGSSNDFLKDIC